MCAVESVGVGMFVYTSVVFAIRRVIGRVRGWLVYWWRDCWWVCGYVVALVGRWVRWWTAGFVYLLHCASVVVRVGVLIRLRICKSVGW